MDIPFLDDNFSFVIQAGCPRFRKSEGVEVEGLCDAIESCFASFTEKLFLGWNGIYIPLDYKYDISVIADDVVDLIAAVSIAPQGVWQTDWPSSGFGANWQVSWNEAELRIQSDWQRMGGAMLGVLVKSPEVVIGRFEFLAEWKRPLEIVLAALSHSGYTADTCSGMSAVMDVVARLAQPGFLYRPRRIRP